MPDGEGDINIMSRARKRRLRQIRRNRRIASVFALVIMAFSVSILFHNFSVQAKQRPAAYKYFTDIRVESGDTLWSIAQEYMTEEYRTPADYIHEIMELNNIGCEIQYGQYLTIPYYSEKLK